ncbi:plasmid replication initiator RepA [Candidatus Pantoea edessiphila]|uniref:Replication initiation protein n=1 Tax=Candidatus Pantoea edessiphila TaxID=2044610 RepID=A0A2P5SV88_9GAMM|nr:plasmid replication initiator RepA [Candidatus Pantoea edessiphila]PPI86254.1 replication initiation protein [Candidatus Pantoea edessiphila]
MNNKIINNINQNPQKKDKRHRGNHSVKCKCPKPEWFAPEHYKSLPGEFGHAMRKLVMKDKQSGKLCLRRRVSRDPYFIKLRKVAGRTRDFRPERKFLVDAIFPLLIQRADIGSWIVTTNITKLANELSPKNENQDIIPETRVSPSRLSRLFPEMMKYGLCDLPNLEWDPVQEYWIPRHIILTERFWKLCGANIDKLLYQRNKRLEAESEGILEPGNYLSLRTARKRWYEKMRLATIKHRREKATSEKRRRRLSKLPIDQRRYTMASWIIHNYPNYILLNMDPESFDRLVWQHLNRLRLGLKLEPGPDNKYIN